MDYTNLHSLNSFFNSKYNTNKNILSFKEYNNIVNNIFKISKMVENSKIDEKSKSYIKDIHPKNTLINIYTKKIYLIDPVLSSNLQINPINAINFFKKLEL
ncbi:MAG: hypothetical protein PHR26_04230 [Candidatus ainarchaeum sp.]|nr:hypothetical protein [Candidatus ainarchaeum sp.]